MAAEPKCIDFFFFAYCKVRFHLNMGMDGYKTPFFVCLTEGGRGGGICQTNIFCFKKKLFFFFKVGIFVRDRTFVKKKI